MDYYLKAETEQALWDALLEAQAAITYDVKNEDGAVIDTRYVPAPGYSIDIIGTIYKPTGNMVQQQGPGNATIEVPEMAPLDGFHANLRGPADLAPKVEYIYYTPTEEERADPTFVPPEPEVITTPSPLESLLVTPDTPSRVWA